MRNPAHQTFSAASVTPGPQTPLNMDYLPLGVSFLGVAIVSGSAEFSVEFTLDDINNLGGKDPFWFTLSDIAAGTNVTKYASVSFPIAFVRLNLTAITGNVQFIVAQSGTSRA